MTRSPAPAASTEPLAPLTLVRPLQPRCAHTPQSDPTSAPRVAGTPDRKSVGPVETLPRAMVLPATDRHPLAPVEGIMAQGCLHLQSNSICWPSYQLTLVSSVASNLVLAALTHKGQRMRLCREIVKKGRKAGLATGIRHRAQSERASSICSPSAILFLPPTHGAPMLALSPV